MPCWSVPRGDGVVGGALEIAGRQVLGRNAPANEASLEDLPDSVQLELVVAGEGQRVFSAIEVDRRTRAFEVVALRDFFAGLVNGVVDFLEIDA